MTDYSPTLLYNRIHNGLAMGCGGSTPVTVKSPPPRTPTPPEPKPRTPTPTPPPPPPREKTADFASDCIDIQIDKGKDENEIQAKEDGYPEPTPSDQVDGGIKPKDKWFEDEDFNNASDDADIFKTEIAVDDDDINIDTLSDTASYISNPTRSAKPNLLFDDVDNHAILASPTLLNSFKDLVQYLKKPFENDRYKNMKTARAIVAWMSNRPMDGVDYGVATTDTPRGLMQYLKENRMTYTTCYTIVCRKAGHQCAIIKGYVKAAGYEPGNKNVPEASWNAVHVECGWQLVHPFWVCRALYGHNLGGWVKVEEDGTTMSKKESASAGVVRNTFQERYFMPDPENFIYECYASDPQWQLVKSSSTVHSKEHFLEMPYLLPPFFGVNFELTIDPKCILYSKEGFCRIDLKGKPANAHMIMLSYELFFKDTENDSKNGFQKEENMSRMVFNSRAAEMFVFDIRFPARGTYKLVIYGGPYKSPALRLCEFRLICD
ncbi:lim and transglutaminase domain protein ltd-1-like [Mercenaria mercenaria]|uniref:lim and transglutaminase domain protein ltd-1-like n=1 Tax=Mercenaria mercenaria TaxID=6596 RepID=UPI00234F87FF|nr:lim and transglutaminase domain protein ltd-1-like [Mercenaria mercenaria]